MESSKFTKRFAQFARYTVIVSAVCVLSCSRTKGDSEIEYENQFEMRKVVLSGEFASVLRELLASPPNEFTEGVSIGMDTKRYLRYEDKTFQVTENQMIHLSDEGVRRWDIEGIQKLLDDQKTDESKVPD